MKTVATFAFASVIVIAAPVTSFAQSAGSSQPHITGAQIHPAKSVSDPDAAENQPWMASGIDLKGPPRRFPAGKTPE